MSASGHRSRFLRNASREILRSLFRTTAPPTFLDAVIPRRAAAFGPSLRRDTTTTNHAWCFLVPVLRTLSKSGGERSLYSLGKLSRGEDAAGRSDGDPMAALGAAAFQHQAAALASHPNEKSVGAPAPSIVGLKGSLHSCLFLPFSLNRRAYPLVFTRANWVAQKPRPIELCVVSSGVLRNGPQQAFWPLFSGLFDVSFQEGRLTKTRRSKEPQKTIFAPRFSLLAINSLLPVSQTSTSRSGTVWDQILDVVQGESRVSSHSFATWFQPASLVGFDGSVLTLRAPSPAFRDWFQKNYAAVVIEALAALGYPKAKLRFDTDELLPREKGEAHAPIESLPLNPRYTFDSFVVGGSNQMAHAAAKAVAEVPSRSYNPLFIYGGVGLGKTHLLQAIGHYLLRRKSPLSVVYVSSEHFVNEVVSAIRYERLVPFRQRYRTVDVLIIDDIQFLSGKQRSQEEFFHLFNALHEAGKQVVISADVPPKQLSDVHERMQSRFASGMTADIGPPDIETRVAILQKMAALHEIEIPYEVALFVASHVRSNVRELEGSFHRLVASASLVGQDIDVALAHKTLKDVLGNPGKKVSIEAIQKAVADHYQLRISDLKAKNNSRSVTRPRQVAMYLVKNLTTASLPEIGRSFGGKHHSTVIHSVKKIEDERTKDADFNSTINAISSSLVSS